MNILTDLLSENVVSALGWSIFHILWQGFLIALMLNIILRILRGKSAQIRYLTALLSLFLTVGLSVFNFTNNYDNSISNDIESNEVLISETKKSVLIIDYNNSNFDLIRTGIVSGLNDNLKRIDKYFPVIVNIWFIGIIIYIFKFIFSYLYTNRLKKVKVRNLSKNWLNRFEKIEEKLIIKKTVCYIESQLVKIPLVLGYLKPVIVIPAEMLSGIPSDQIEAIIAHELAHIRRNDYIINVLQTIIETVFFFHPAVWYVSSQIRNERENCCDDIALTVCNGSLVYAKALVSVQELTLGKYYAAVAFSGRKKHLLNRIKRTIMKQKVKSNFTDKIIAATIILSGVLALSFTYKADITNHISEHGFVNSITEVNSSETPAEPVAPSPPELIEEISESDMISFRDTTRNRMPMKSIDIEDNTIIKTYRDDEHKKKEMKFTLEHGKVTKLYVDGKEIPESEYDKYQPEIDETITDLKEAKEDIREAMKDIEELDFEEIRMEIEESMKDVHVDMAEIQDEIAKAMEEVHEIDFEDIMNEVEMKLNDIDFDFDFDFDFSGETFHFDMKELDMDKIREEMERTREIIREQVDMEEIQKELIKVQEELSKISKEEIEFHMQESITHFEEFDKDKTIKKLEEKLEEIENLELEEEK
ncbi:MAG: M48 family metalloprotease [Bacteroidales bacterium]|nr:M48 family metalloprotease [Bacteroidales bacterium]